MFMKLGIMRYRNIVALTLLVLYAPLSFAGEDWAQKEILQQLSEIRRDINVLKNDVNQLKKAVSTVTAKNGRNVTTVSMDDDYKLGRESSTAKVAIVEFSDYECPYCKRHHSQTLPRLKQNYIDTGKVQYVMRDYPLGFHSNAKSAAIAANCAGEQGAYWPMHDELFNAKGAKGDAMYKNLARQLKLDEAKFDVCLNDPMQTKEVEADLAYGTSLNVSGTPAFFIGKLVGDKIVDAKFISGAQPYSVFARTIDSYLN